MKNTVDNHEIESFNAIPIEEWLHPKGTMRGLHEYNKYRVPFIQKSYTLCLNKKRSFSSLLWCKLMTMPLLGRMKCRKTVPSASILDIGAGSSILSLALAKEGNKTVAMEPAAVISEGTAKLVQCPDLLHCSNYSFYSPLTHWYYSYDCTSAQDAGQTEINPFCVRNNTTVYEEPIKQGDGVFDITILSEVIEHVADGEVPDILRDACKWTKSGGMVVVTAPQRSFLSALTLIGFGEYILKLLPKGTHQYRKFVKPKTVVHEIKPFADLISYATPVYLPFFNSGIWLSEPFGRFSYCMAFRVK